jgi:hypothetical protein
MGRELIQNGGSGLEAFELLKSSKKKLSLIYREIFALSRIKCGLYGVF